MLDRVAAEMSGFQEQQWLQDGVPTAEGALVEVTWQWQQSCRYVCVGGGFFIKDDSGNLALRLIPPPPSNYGDELAFFST